MEGESSCKNQEMAKLKIGGAWSGVLEVELENWTLPMLREEVAKRSNCPPATINMISGGRILKDGEGSKSLIQVGIKNNAKILVSKISADQGKALKDELVADEERSRRLARIKAAAIALAQRHADGSLPVEDFNIELEDQSGQKVHLGSENDQRAVMMGLMLHANGKQLMKRNNYKDALDVLMIGEESFSLCDPKVIEMVDNVPILQIDMVWCYFMLRDMSWLSMAGVRLMKAREGLERSHGKESARFRVLQAGRHPELAIYLRLDLLEGVVAYHSGHFEQSRKALSSAQAKYHQLQVSDEALSMLMSMGYPERAAKRALRMTNQDVQNAVDFLEEEKEKRSRREQEDIQRNRDIKEQKSFGMTPLKKAVDLQRLNELVSYGFEKKLAAEALRRNENDTQKALDDLTNPETNATLQIYIETRKHKKAKHAAQSDIQELLAMGFEKSRVIAALNNLGTKEAALNSLIAEPATNSNITEPATDSTDAVNGAVHSANLVDEDEPNGQTSVKTEDRDSEMEDEIAQELTGDALSDYDIEVTKEGEAITEYLAMLASTATEMVQ